MYTELTAAWGTSGVRQSSPAEGPAGPGARVLAGGARAALALRALAAALDPPPAGLDDAQTRLHFFLLLN